MSISFPFWASWQADGKCLTGLTSQTRERHSSAGLGACIGAQQPDGDCVCTASNCLQSMCRLTTGASQESREVTGAVFITHGTKTGRG